MKSSLSIELVKPARKVYCVPEEYGTHRYSLRIELPGDGAAMTVLMKNPSTASATRSDATIGKVEAWATRRNYRVVTIVNLFGYRSPYPEKLNEFAYDFVVGPENDSQIKNQFRQAATIVAAWGNPNGINPTFYDRRIREVLSLLEPTQLKNLKIVGERTQQGYPRHARMWNNNPALQDYFRNLE